MRRGGELQRWGRCIHEYMQRLFKRGDGRTKRRRITGNRGRGAGFPTRLLEILAELRLVLLQPVPLVDDDQLPEEPPLEEVRFRHEHLVRRHHHVEVGRVLHRLLCEAQCRRCKKLSSLPYRRYTVCGGINFLLILKYINYRLQRTSIIGAEWCTTTYLVSSCGKRVLRVVVLLLSGVKQISAGVDGVSVARRKAGSFFFTYELLRKRNCCCSTHCGIK